jgi:hypothetical protein
MALDLFNSLKQDPQIIFDALLQDLTCLDQITKRVKLYHLLFPVRKNNYPLFQRYIGSLDWKNTLEKLNDREIETFQSWFGK